MEMKDLLSTRSHVTGPPIGGDFLGRWKRTFCAYMCRPFVICSNKKMSLHCSQLILNFMCNTKYVPYFNKLFLICSIYVVFSCSLRLGAHVVTPKWISTWHAKLQLRSLPTNKTLVLDMETIWSHVLLIHLINGDHHFPHDCFNTLYDIICSHIVHPAFCIVVFCFCLFPGSKHGNKGQGDALM